MKFNKKILFELISKLKKSELIEYLKNSYHEMDDKQKRYVFGELYKKEINKKRTPLKLYYEIKLFYRKSNEGVYYAPFYIDSKNYMHVPNETDEWFSELSDYLDESSKLVNIKEFDLANKCFEILYDLIDKMEEGGEMIFADEYGTWMITPNFDYDEAYIKSTAQTNNEIVFAEKVIPLLIRDSYESLSGKIYSKVKKHSNVKQFKEIQRVIKSKKIRVK